MNDQLKKRIEDQLKSNKVMLFMKGTAEMPQCGFSAKTVSILKSYGIAFKTFNILEDEDIRQGLKEYSDWPTFPQLYVDSVLIGGCDIITEMHENGELKSTLLK
jgi:monothiol glutaredoxin